VAHLARTARDELPRIDKICLPHDYLNWRLTGELATDRSDASGSGWWSPTTGQNRRDLLALAAGKAFAARVAIPDVRGASEPAGTLTAQAGAALGLPAGIPVGPGAGDNAAAAVGIGATPEELVISLGTSGVAFAVSDDPTSDPSGEVCGFADATGRFLPLVCMINCTRVVSVQADLFGWSVQEALDRAAEIAPGSDGLLLMPFLGGERTPNLPNATGSLHGVTAVNSRPEVFVRAAVDGVAAGLAYCVIALARQGVEKPGITLVGGGSRHRTWQQAIADATGLPVTVRGGGEHVARGAAVQIAAILRDEPVSQLATAWRPEVIAQAAPRPEHRAAFRMDDRQAIVESMRATAPRRT
jgi:xylulokinase